MSHEEHKERLGLAALDALDEAELRSLQEHLETCAECREELAKLRDTAAALIYLTPPVAASAELRARILAAINAPGMRRVSGVDGPGETEETERATEQPSSTASNAVHLSPTRQRWSTSARISALAASLIFALLIVAIIVLTNRNREMQAELARLSQRRDEIQTELDRLRERNNELQTEIARFSNRENVLQPESERLPDRNNEPQGETARQQEPRVPVVEEPTGTETPVTPPSATPDPDARIAELAGTDNAPQARARLSYNSRSGVVTLSVSELPPAPVGKAYQLWYLVKGRPIPGGVFVTGSGGRATMSGQLPSDARGASAFVVTLEDRSGASKPTGPKYLLGKAS